MPLQRTFRLALAALAASCVASCYMPAPVAHARLQVAPDGSYTLNHSAVAGDQLSGEISKLKPASTTLVVEIQASPQASQQAITSAVHSITAAHATVAFAPTAASAP